ncbi:MAG TPA: type II toxin-antitoxin system RelE/ParE family toxin [Acetobacteraceae bacterium]|nr:type II toxin-antitoxin system RelE/ParE family toxin [Acetobacteraceae bacterium]
MRTFKNKAFARFARKAGVGDVALLDAVGRAERGLIDAELGGGVIKQRIARPGGGRSGGFRTIILFQAGSRAFFVHGFAKNERDNIGGVELAAFKKLAAALLAYEDAALATAIAAGILMEVAGNEQAISQPRNGFDP